MSENDPAMPQDEQLEEETTTQVETNEPEQPEPEEAAPEPAGQGGNGSSGQTMVQRTVTDKALIPLGESALSRGRVPKPPARVPARMSGVRKLTEQRLNDMAQTSDSCDMELSVERYSPLNFAGVPIPNGHILRAPIMPFDHLKKAIADAWGGGFYRVWTVVKSTNVYDTKHLPLMFEISMVTSMPKLEMHQETVKADPAGSKNDPVVDEAKLMQEQTKMELLEAQQINARNRRLKAKAEAMKEQREIEKMMRGEDGEEGGQLKQLQEQMAAERKQLQEQMAAERKASEDRYQEMLKQQERAKDQSALEQRFSKLESTLEKLAEALAKPRGEEAASSTKTLEILMQGMQSQTQAMLQGMQQTQAAIAGTQGKSDEMAKMFERVADMTVKASSRDNANQLSLMEKVFALTNKGKDDQQSVLALIKLGQDMQAQTIRTMRDLGMIGASGAGGEASEDGAEWDANQGIMGNVGKLIFYGLKALANRAAEDPSTLSALGRLTGLQGGEMDDAHLAQAANRLATTHQAALPRPPQGAPMVFQTPMPQQRPVQQQMQRPPVRQPIVTPPPQAVPVFKAPPVVQTTVAPPVQIPTDVTTTAAESSTTVIAAEIKTVAEAAPVTPEITEGEAQPVAETPEQGEPVAQIPEDSEERLRMRVDEVMSMALEDIKDGIEAHEWPLEAKKSWNKVFLTALAAEPDDKKRMDLIQAKTNMILWDEISGLVFEDAEHPEERKEARLNFINAIKQLVALVNEEKTA